MRKKSTNRKSLTLADRIALYEFMKPLFEKDGDYIAYTGDWSDEKVAEKFAITAKQVASVRVECFGRLSSSRGDHFVPYPKLVERVKTLEALVAQLEDSVGNLTGASVFGGSARPYTNGHSNRPTVGA